MFDGKPDLLVAVSGFRVVATAVRPPPLNIVLSETDDGDALDAFVDAFAATNPSGVTGPAEHAAAFSERWSATTGRGHRLSRTERLFGLSWIDNPPRGRGVLRAAGRADRELVAAWLHAFESETAGREVPPISPATVDRWVSARGRTMYLWDDGGPVSMCGVGGATPHGIRVGPVYTPREWRRRGYASSLVAAACQAQLDGGRGYCFLFTDVTRPEPNAMFEAIGFEEIRSIAMYAFDKA
jgi:GNAT superfamily N-acetyltransferase